MTDSEMKIKLSYITGLKPVVLDELKKINFEIISEDTDSFFIEFSEKVIQQVKKLRSVARVYLVMQGDTYHPTYIALGYDQHALRARLKEIKETFEYPFELITITDHRGDELHSSILKQKRS